MYQTFLFRPENWTDEPVQSAHFALIDDRRYVLFLGQATNLAEGYDISFTEHTATCFNADRQEVCIAYLEQAPHKLPNVWVAVHSNSDLTREASDPIVAIAQLLSCI